MKQLHLGPSSAWGPQSHPTRNTHDIKQRHLWGGTFSRNSRRDCKPQMPLLGALTVLFHVGVGFTRVCASLNTPPNPHRKTLPHLSCHPPLSVSQEISLQIQIVLHGGVAATLTPTALHCATKVGQSQVNPQPLGAPHGVYKPVQRRDVNRPLFGDDEVGPHLIHWCRCIHSPHFLFKMRTCLSIRIIHLTITGECFTYSLHSRKYFISIKQILGDWFSYSGAPHSETISTNPTP